MTVQLETPAETRERCATHGATWLGDRVEFKTGGKSVKRALARELFERHGYAAHLPADPKPDTVLVRASREGKKPKGYITKAFVSPNADTPMAIHITRVDAGSGESGDQFTCHARVRISYRTDPATWVSEPFAVAKPPEGKATFDDFEARDRAVAIAQQANVIMGEAQNKDVGAWLRSVLQGVGGCQSLGQGNNYYVPAPLVDQLHAFLTDAVNELGIFYLRDPKTTMGAKHDRATMAAAVQRNLETELAALKVRLGEVTAADGTKVKGTSLKKQIADAQAIGAKLDLYKEIVEARVSAPIAALRAQLERHFDTLINGGAINNWAAEPSTETPDTDGPDDDGPDGGDAVPAPEPTPEPVKATAPEPEQADDDPFAWCAG